MVLIFFLILAVTLTVLLRVVSVYADTWNNISATIKISVCGNEIIEGGEDCEGENLNGQTCESLGYGPGNLSCDIACSFDTYGCSPAPSPTPTPTPTPIPTPTATATPTSASTTTSSTPPASDESSIVTSFLTSTPTPTSIVSSLPIIPDVLRFYTDYLNENGRIKAGELYNAVKSWVDDWKKVILAFTHGEDVNTRERRCDVNQDNRCDLKDLSILLFYVER